MDIELERILSLIPRKPDGKFVHGAVKDFAIGLGLKSGNIVSDWIAGRSTSYTGYRYQISDKYDVSVEWLRGETDEKKPIVFDGGPIGYSDLNAENQEFINQMIAKLLASQSQQ